MDGFKVIRLERGRKTVLATYPALVPAMAHYQSERLSGSDVQLRYRRGKVRNVILDSRNSKPPKAERRNLPTPEFIPSSEAVCAEARKIRRGWSKEERRKRRVRSQRRQRSLNLPGVVWECTYTDLTGDRHPLPGLQEDYRRLNEFDEASWRFDRHYL